MDAAVIDSECPRSDRGSGVSCPIRHIAPGDGRPQYVPLIRKLMRRPPVSAMINCRTPTRRRAPPETGATRGPIQTNGIFLPGLLSTFLSRLGLRPPSAHQGSLHVRSCPSPTSAFSQSPAVLCSISRFQFLKIGLGHTILQATDPSTSTRSIDEPWFAKQRQWHPMIPMAMG